MDIESVVVKVWMGNVKDDEEDYVLFIYVEIILIYIMFGILEYCLCSYVEVVCGVDFDFYFEGVLFEGVLV